MLALGLFSLLFITLHAQQCPPWSFDDSLANGPSHWAELCPQYLNCRTGQAQSPIDIIHNAEIKGQTAHLGHKYVPLIKNFTFGNEDYAFEVFLLPLFIPSFFPSPPILVTSP